MSKHIEDLFEKHFASNVSSSLMECACGEVYFCHEGADYTEDEIEAERQAGANFVDYWSRRIRFEGKEYSDLCGCWHDRRDKIIGFLTSHHHAVVPFLNAVRDFRLAQAKNLPEGNTNDDT